MDRWRLRTAMLLILSSLAKKHINKQDFYIEFAQRLKRRNTVIDKLLRKDKDGNALISDVSAMHDFAGCRMIFDDLAQMEEFRRYMHSSAVMKNVEHILRHDPDKYDYIKHPNFTGYRGIHDVYRHFPEDPSASKKRNLGTGSWLKSNIALEPNTPGQLPLKFQTSSMERGQNLRWSRRHGDDFSLSPVNHCS